MTISRSTKPARKKGYIFRVLFATALTTTMVATGGFGALPENQMTNNFQVVISESFPPEVLNPFNTYMTNLSAPQISPKADSSTDIESPPDPFGAFLSFFGLNAPAAATLKPSFVEATIAAIEKTQTQVVAIQSRTVTATQIQTLTQTVVPSLAFTASPVPTLSGTPTFAPPVYYFPPTATEESEPDPTSAPTANLTLTYVPTPSNLVLYFGDTSMGNIGPRSSADALCIANLPFGYSNYHAFLGYSASDSISSFPTNYGVPINFPIRSVTSTTIANDWADLMDGSIAVALDAAGVSTTYNWWSGVENADGTHIDGTTFDCNDWTSNSGFVGGNEGFRSAVDSTWMDGFVAACNQPIAVLCIAY